MPSGSSQTEISSPSVVQASRHPHRRHHEADEDLEHRGRGERAKTDTKKKDLPPLLQNLRLNAQESARKVKKRTKKVSSRSLHLEVKIRKEEKVGRVYNASLFIVAHVGIVAFIQILK